MVPEVLNLPFVLFVDDDLDSLEVLSWFAKRWDFHTEGVATGKDALTVALGRHPDIVVLDIMMPDMSGFDVLDALKSDVRTSHMPVILLTAGPADEAFRQRGREKGAAEYLVKPVNPFELMSRINYHLGRHEQERDTTLLSRPRDSMRSVECGAILVVDDDLALLETIEDVLSAEYETVLIARNAFEALAILRDNPGVVSLVIADLHMPEMSGVALIRRVMLLYPTIAVLAISGDVARYEKELQSLVRVIPTLQKPLDLNKLRSAVADSLREQLQHR